MVGRIRYNKLYIEWWTLSSVTDKSGNFTVSVVNTPTRVSADLNGLNVWDFDGTESLITNSELASSGNHCHWSS